MLGPSSESEPTASTLDRLAYAAWPAEVDLSLASWRLRYTHGVTRRANSVWCGADVRALARDDIERRLDRAEAFYGERDADCLVHVRDHRVGRAIDAALEQRGYGVEAPVSLQTAPAEAVRRPAWDLHPFECSSALTPEWLEAATLKGRFNETAGVYRALLDRIGCRARFASCRSEAGVRAIGLAVLDGPYCGIFGMSTQPEARRGGYGRALLSGMASAVEREGARWLYLQVERDNPAALELYRAAGFSERVGTWYRRLRR